MITDMEVITRMVKDMTLIEALYSFDITMTLRVQSIHILIYSPKLVHSTRFPKNMTIVYRTIRVNLQVSSMTTSSYITHILVQSGGIEENFPGFAVKVQHGTLNKPESLVAMGYHQVGKTSITHPFNWIPFPGNEDHKLLLCVWAGVYREGAVGILECLKMISRNSLVRTPIISNTYISLGSLGYPLFEKLPYW